VQITSDDEADFPVARVGNGGRLWMLWAHYNMDKSAILDPKDPYSNPVFERLAYSDDGGKSFSPPIDVAGGAVMHQFPALALSDGGKQISVSWLDYTTGHATGREAVPMQATTTTDGGATWSAAADIASLACVCCQPYGSEGYGGPMFTYRGYQKGGKAGDIRDIKMSTLTNAAWSPPETVHDDKYVSKMCPSVGPATILDGQGTMHVMYWVGQPHTGYWYTTRTKSTPFSEPIMVAQSTMDGPNEYNNTLALDADGNAWTATVTHGMYAMNGKIDKTQNTISVYYVTPAGAVIKPPQPQIIGAYPMVASVGDAIVLTWVDGGTLHSRRIEKS
jgi:hypothetical protein